MNTMANVVTVPLAAQVSCHCDQLKTSIVHFSLGILKNTRKLPPGPLALPIVGSVHLIIRDLRKSLQQLAEKYGGVYTIYLGRQPVVVLASYEAIKEAYVKNAPSFCGRPWTYLEEGVTRGGTIVSMDWGQKLKDHRHLLQTFIKNMAFSTERMEDTINAETLVFLNQIKKTNEKPFDISTYLRMALTNCTLMFTFGSRLDYKDPTLKFHMRCSKVIFDLGIRTGILGFLSFLKYIPGDPFKHFYLRRTCDELRKLVHQKVAEHRQMLHQSKGDNYVDCYLQEINMHKGNPNSSFTDDNLVNSVFELLSAAHESAITTLRWAVTFLAHNPGMQNKIHAEIDEVLGRETKPSMADMRRMHYCMAAFTEAQRLGDPSPFGAIHRTREDVLIHGHFIPKGMWVFPDLNAIHHSPQHYDQPQQFRPERFLDSEMHYVKPEKLFSFSIGRRSCPGEPLARMEMILIFIQLFQHFTFVSGDNKNPLDGVHGIRYMPKEFKIRAVAR